jgi:hypothetical protein
MFVRFAAVCVMGMSLVELTLNWAEFAFRHQPLDIISIVIWVILFCAGIVALIKARAIADWIADKLE